MRRRRSQMREQAPSKVRYNFQCAWSSTHSCCALRSALLGPWRSVRIIGNVRCFFRRGKKLARLLLLLLVVLLREDVMGSNECFSVIRTAHLFASIARVVVLIFPTGTLSSLGRERARLRGGGVQEVRTPCGMRCVSPFGAWMRMGDARGCGQGRPTKEEEYWRWFEWEKLCVFLFCRSCCNDATAPRGSRPAKGKRTCWGKVWKDA